MKKFPIIISITIVIIIVIVIYVAYTVTDRNIRSLLHNRYYWGAYNSQKI
jgi:hypothetical protein